MMKKVILLFALSFAAVPVAWAECKTECGEAYESAVESCASAYVDPADSEDLAACMESAEQDYDSCVDECGGPGEAV